MDAVTGSSMGMSALDLAFEVDYWGYAKSALFYVMLTICAAQTFYPILMIIAMFIRQLGFLAHYFHEVGHRNAICNKQSGDVFALIPLLLRRTNRTGFVS